VGRDQDVIVLEQGERVGSAVRQWGHVRLFSPWSELTSPAAVSLLEGTGWAHPDPVAYQTGADWVGDYLDPLAAGRAGPHRAARRRGGPRGPGPAGGLRA